MKRVTVAVAVLVMVGLVPTMSSAASLAYPDLERINASSPTAAAIQISQQLFDDNSTDAVVLARNDAFPDGLGASALTGAVRGPLLLTNRDSLPEAVKDEIIRVLRADGSVYLLGGTAAIAASIEQELDAVGYRTPRFPGKDRVDTAGLVARFIGAGPGASVLLARASGRPDNTQGWVDSVSCGGYAAETSTPIVLTSTYEDTVAEGTMSTLSQLGVRRVHVCGGAAAVPETQVEQLRAAGITVERHAGSERAATAVAVAEELWDVSSHAGRSFVLTPGFGADFGFGLVASQLSASLDAPILLVDDDAPMACGDGRGNATLCYLAKGSGQGQSLVVMGTTRFISDEVAQAAAAAADLPLDDDPPSIPSDVVADEVDEDDGTSLTVSWSESTDISTPVEYEVLVRPSSAEGDLTADNAAIQVQTSLTSVALHDLVAGTSYDIAVRASDPHDNTSSLSAVVVATPVDEVPAAPAADVGPNVVPDASTGLRVSWPAAPEDDVAGYDLQRLRPGLLASGCSVGLGGDDWATLASPVAPSTEVHDTTAESGTDYCYRYRIVDTTENATAWSGATGPVAAT